MSPNQPGTPNRCIRISDELWSAAQAKADAEGRPLSEAVRELLERWVARPVRKAKQ